MTSTALERTVDTVCLIASVVFLYLLPYRISILFYLLFGCSAFLFCIGFFRLVATIDEPSLPETAYLTGLTFMVGGMAVNACGIYGVYSGQGSGRSIMIATLTLIEALVLYSMAGGLIKSPAVKRVVAIMYRVARPVPMINRYRMLRTGSEESLPWISGSLMRTASSTAAMSPCMRR